MKNNMAGGHTISELEENVFLIRHTGLSDQGFYITIKGSIWVNSNISLT